MTLPPEVSAPNFALKGTSEAHEIYIFNKFKGLKPKYSPS